MSTQEIFNNLFKSINDLKIVLTNCLGLMDSIIKQVEENNKEVLK